MKTCPKWWGAGYCRGWTRWRPGGRRRSERAGSLGCIPKRVLIVDDPFAVLHVCGSFLQSEFPDATISAVRERGRSAGRSCQGGLGGLLFSDLPLGGRKRPGPPAGELRERFCRLMPIVVYTQCIRKSHWRARLVGLEPRICHQRPAPEDSLKLSAQSCRDRRFVSPALG